jgi:hypothetical protein
MNISWVGSGHRSVFSTPMVIVKRTTIGVGYTEQTDLWPGYRNTAVQTDSKVRTSKALHRWLSSGPPRSVCVIWHDKVHRSGLYTTDLGPGFWPTPTLRMLHSLRVGPETSPHLVLQATTCLKLLSDFTMWFPLLTHQSIILQQTKNVPVWFSEKLWKNLIPKNCGNTWK